MFVLKDRRRQRTLFIYLILYALTDSNPSTNPQHNLQAWRSFYRWQWLYLPPLYGVLGIKFRVQDIMETYGR